MIKLSNQSYFYNSEGENSMKSNVKSDAPAFFTQGLVWALAAMFIISGLTKFLGSAALLDTFANWGYPAWFAYLIGGVELFAGILLMVPHLKVFGAFILTMEMFGAFLTHAMHGEVLMAFLPLVVMGLTATVTYLYSGEFFMNFKRLLHWHDIDAKTKGQPRLYKPAPEAVRVHH